MFFVVVSCLQSCFSLFFLCVCPYLQLCFVLICTCVFSVFFTCVFSVFFTCVSSVFAVVFRNELQLFRLYFSVVIRPY